MEPEIIIIEHGGKLYPRMLLEIPDPPKQLFVIGDPKVLNEPSVAIVGTRKPTDYGIRAAAYFAKSLTNNLVIVSGLAYGIDTVALDTAVAENKQPVIGVIGSGLDKASFYPKANWPLAIKIIANGGAIVSEYPPGTEPLKYHFPARNRIIAGLSKGTLVIEAGDKSGALITANLALDYNREVFALGSSIFIAQGNGTNKLIKEGAYLATIPNDILDVLEIGSTFKPE